MSDWFRAFFLTQLVEMPIYRWLGSTSWRVAFLASLVTHPFVWFAFPLLPLSWTTTTVLSEVFAVVVEMLLVKHLAKLSYGRAFMTSIVANAASVAIGFALRAATGWV